jgi:alginate O-acetyltransferase complex protein AlgI
MLFLVGFIKKTCISDNLSPFADAYFQNPSIFHGSSACLAVLLYSAQIYCDFSGYTDMAIAVSGLFGYRLTENFNAPYLAHSVTDFWHRWHISLSTWLRDYLYIPLGGNRRGKIIMYRNIMLTMLLGGLWHGASWNFVLWGGMHGLALSMHKLWTDLRGPTEPARHSLKPLAWLVTMFWVCLAWVPFRASNFNTCLEIWRGMAVWVPESVTACRTLPVSLWLVLAMLLFSHFLVHRRGVGPWWRTPRRMEFATLYGILWALAIGFKATTPVPFIYFQF